MLLSFVSNERVDREEVVESGIHYIITIIYSIRKREQGTLKGRRRVGHRKAGVSGASRA